MRRLPLLAIALAPCLGAGRTAVAAQQPPIPIRPLGATIGTFSDSLGNSTSIRALGDGRVLVNDPGKRRLLLLDSTLHRAITVADTTAATTKAYGGGLIGMMRFTEDSSLVLDELTGAFLIVDPAGKIARIVAKPANVRAAIGRLTAPLYDQAGHVVFPAPPTIFLSLLDPDFVGDTLMRGPDSAAILRQNLATRRIDTIAMLQAPRIRQAVTRRANGGSGRAAVNPLPSGDDWTVLDDGTVAIVRVRDYHVDWISPDGHVSSSPRIPTQWVRLTDSMKVAIIDSVRGRDGAAAVAGDGGPLPFSQRRAYVEPSDLPDYRPPFISGFARGDNDGNLWVRVNTDASLAGGAVYDVISRGGERIDRVQLPRGGVLIGFGPGVAYLASRTGATMQLSKARIR